MFVNKENTLLSIIYLSLTRITFLTSLRRIQWTMTITKPCNESNTAKSIWNNMERLSVMARTADIHVRARRGNTTQELQRDALLRQRKPHHTAVGHVPGNNQTPIPQSILLCGTKTINLETTKQINI